MEKNIKKIVIIVLVAIVVIFSAANCFTIVNAGHTGVVVTLGKVNEGVL